jgi:glycosyltransferase involved in cell wall biosynthesis
MREFAMPMTTAPRKVAYLLKRYPRFSETFVVGEILAHEAAGTTVEIIALRPVAEAYFQGSIGAVRSPVTYVPERPVKASALWTLLDDLRHNWPSAWRALEHAEIVDPDDLFQALWVARLVRERGITHLHAHFATVATTVARLVALMTGVTYGFTAHAKDIYHDYPEDQQLRLKLRDASYVVTVSDYNVRHLRQSFGGDAAAVTRIYNGLDLAAMPYRSPKDRAPLILGVGRLIEKKGFDVLIDACRMLKDAGCAFRCRIIGGGERLGDLEAQIGRLGLADRVELAGPLPREVVQWSMQEAAVLAAPCVVGADGNRDGMPTVLLEAMALGTPCIATPVTGIPELIEDGVTGLLVEERDASGLATQLRRLLTDHDLREALAAPARLKIEREFDVRENAARLRALFAAAAAETVSLRRAS